jgi:hypothetical protein
MRSTIIEQEAGFLGPFQRKLQPGQTQHLTFQPDDVGPCWMTPAEQEASFSETDTESSLLDDAPAAAAPTHVASCLDVNG